MEYTVAKELTSGKILQFGIVNSDNVQTSLESSG